MIETDFVGKYLAKVNNKDAKAYFLKVVTILSMLTLILLIRIVSKFRF